MMLRSKEKEENEWKRRENGWRSVKQKEGRRRRKEKKEK